MKVTLFTAKNGICAAVGVAGSVVANLLGGWNNSMKSLLICMVADYITGLIVAGVFKKSGKSKTGALSSQAGWKGLAKKGVTLLIVMVANQMDVTLGMNVIREAVVIGFLANEIISIVENAGLMGIPIPAVITKAIEVLKSKGENADVK